MSDPSEVFWGLVASKLTRPEFDALIAAGGPAAVLAAHPPFDPATASDRAPPFTFVKDTSAFRHFEEFPIVEPPLEAFASYYTPNELFFVCNEITTARILPNRYRLAIEGDAVARPLELGYNDLVALPSVELPAYLECAGNGRSLFEAVLGRPAEDVQWGLGGVGMARWTGVPLCTVLELAGVAPDAAYVNLKGLDRNAPEGGVSRPLTIAKALHPDTLLAYGMNGEILPPDHGFPVRAIVPGWIGAASVKWLGTITVSTRPIWVERNTATYTYQGADWPAERYAPAWGAPIDAQNVRSHLVLPWPARLAPGAHTLRGIARSPFAEIRRVEWSADGGASWREARLPGPSERWAWAFFEFDWDAAAGERALLTRATDALGNTQPERIPFNRKGYMFNMIHPHPVVVA